MLKLVYQFDGNHFIEISSFNHKNHDKRNLDQPARKGYQ